MTLFNTVKCDLRLILDEIQQAGGFNEVVVQARRDEEREDFVRALDWVRENHEEAPYELIFVKSETGCGNISAGTV